MGGIESGPRPNIGVRKEITHEDFAKKVNTYSPAQQEAIATLSSILLEPDLRQKVINDSQELKTTVSILKETGLGIKDILYVMRYFGLPNPKPSISPNLNS